MLILLSRSESRKGSPYRARVDFPHIPAYLLPARCDGMVQRPPFESSRMFHPTINMAVTLALSGRSFAMGLCEVPIE